MVKSDLDWAKKKVLVTGAGGFIGSHLIERLVELGADARALVHYNALGRWGWLDESPIRDQIQVIAGDISDRDSVRQAMQGVDVVFHLAALIGIPYSYHAPLSYVQTNIVGTLNVLQNGRQLGIGRVIHTSTSEAYGSAQYVPIDEEHPLQGQSPYSATKIGADKMAESFHLAFDFPVATIRPFNTYGPRQSARAVIPTIVTQALTQDEIRLGNLQPTRDLNYIKDTVEGFLYVASREDAIGEVINIGSGQEISIGNLANLILEIMGKDLPIVSESQRVRPDASEVDRLCADHSKAKELLDWQPRYTLKQGLRETIAWFETNLDHYRSENYSI
jgi:dTDP-glucose 4,6-dehydratase